MEKLLSVDEVVAVFGCGKSTLSRWIKEGKIEAVKVGQKLLFKREAVQKTIEAATKTGASNE